MTLTPAKLLAVLALVVFIVITVLHIIGLSLTGLIALLTIGFYLVLKDLV